MTFKKGEVINRGAHLSAEMKAKIIADRKSGKKWREIAAELNIPTKRAMTYAKRKWYKAGMNDVIPGNREDIEDKDFPRIEDKNKPGRKEGEEEDKEEPGKKEGVVDKTKKKAAGNIDKEVSKQIKKTTPAPKSSTKGSNVNNDKGGGDKVAKTGLSERKSVNIWFLVAIIIAVVTIGLIFIILRPKAGEKADYNNPTDKDEDKGGFDGRKISEFNT